MDIKIDFDTFPSNLFSTTTGDRASKARALALRSGVQRAADTWSSYLTDIFPRVPAGSIIRVGDPRNGATTIISPINTVVKFTADIVIFAASSYLFNPTVNATTSTIQDLVFAPQVLDQEYVKAGLSGINYQPFAASISFNEFLKWYPFETDIQETQKNIYITALHEIGHILGFNDIPAYQRYVNGSIYKGVNTTQTLADKAHLNPETNSPNPNRVILPDSNGVFGEAIMINAGGGYFGSYRVPPQPDRALTHVDLKILADIGYEVVKPAGTLGSTIPLFAQDLTTGVYSLTVDPAWNANSTPKYNGIIAGNAGNDSITGNAENEFFAGGPGDDTLSGGVGNDSLYGGEGNDSLLGGPGDDFVYGGLGNDQLFSGGGRNYLTGAGQDANGNYGFNEKDTLVRSAFSLRTTFVIGETSKGNFYNNNDGFNSTNTTNDFDKDYATIIGYTSGQDRIQISQLSLVKTETINGDTWIFDAISSDLLAKVLGTPREEITFVNSIT